MTKPAALLLATQVDMVRIPDEDRDAARRFCTQYLRGMSEEMHKRFMRAAKRLMNASAGEGFMFYVSEDRSWPAHARWMAIEERIYAHQDFFTNKKAFRLWLKTGAAFGKFEMGKDRFGADRMVFVPASVEYEQCSDDEFRTYVDDATEFLRSDRAQRRLWRHLPPYQRAAMVESLMADPREQPQ